MVGSLNNMKAYASKWTWSRTTITRNAVGDETGSPTVQTLSSVPVYPIDFETDEIDEDTILSTDILLEVWPFQLSDGTFVVPKEDDVFVDPAINKNYVVKKVFNQQISANVLMWELQVRG